MKKMFISILILLVAVSLTGCAWMSGDYFEDKIGDKLTIAERCSGFSEKAYTRSMYTISITIPTSYINLDIRIKGTGSVESNLSITERLEDGSEGETLVEQELTYSDNYITLEDGTIIPSQLLLYSNIKSYSVIENDNAYEYSATLADLGESFDKQQYFEAIKELYSIFNLEKLVDFPVENQYIIMQAIATNDKARGEGKGKMSRDTIKIYVSEKPKLIAKSYPYIEYDDTDIAITERCYYSNSQ
ncbi:hypothetical protein HB943_14700 [Listeria weihenstephanensis]|uniref:Lipoprotein n=1 Tax=Listeria weihenstephanensis TaxID=1006155 RepID=A0A841Z9J1_9LIST|nr:hypothetical protein [Listeria weihenstephanensis]MBC1501848.1 hypothetical protein [Listeria weihenstephanensis]